MPVRTLKAVALIIVLFAALAGGYLLGTHRPAGHDQALDQQVAKGQADAEKKQQYTCGMHPFIIQDEPGLCPICGMTLVPLKPGAAGSQPQAAQTPKKWRSPMDPTYVRDAPGKDSMGHDLVPVHEDGEAAEGRSPSIRSPPRTWGCGRSRSAAVNCARPSAPSAW